MGLHGRGGPREEAARRRGRVRVMASEEEREEVREALVAVRVAREVRRWVSNTTQQKSTHWFFNERFER